MEDIVDDTPFWGVLEFTLCDWSTDSEFVFTCRQRRFIVQIAAENLAASPQLRDKYLFLLDAAKHVEPDENTEDEHFELDGHTEDEHVEPNKYTEEDLFDWVSEPMLPIFRQLSPRNHIGSTLDEFLFPETQVYEVLADGDKLVAIQQHEAEDIPKVFGVSFPKHTDFTPWPIFAPSEIRTSNEQIGAGPSHAPRKVFLNDGTVAYLKLIRPGDDSIFLHEIETYRQIHAARLDKALRISRLIGLVGSREQDVALYGQDVAVTIYGLLLTYIDCGHQTLLCAVQPETPEHLRAQWAAQVGDALAQLHAAGLVWGDAKPDNVLVDRHDDAWIVDFGGGYTEGWVERGVAGTREGDVQALGRITEFIRTAKEPSIEIV